MQDVLRSQYRIHILCRNVAKLTRRQKKAYRLSSRPTSGYTSPATTLICPVTPHSTRFPRSPRAPSEHSSQGKAMAKLQAYQNVRSRLIKETT